MGVYFRKSQVLSAAVLTAALLALPGGARVTGRTLAASPVRAAGTAAASASTDLYVDSQVSCSDSGSGTETLPFCNIGPAASAARPGDTVVVEPGGYAEATISVSGTSSEPITFAAVNAPQTEVGVSGGLVVSGAQDVVISGFNLASENQPLLIDNSSNVTIKGGSAVGSSATLPAVQVTGTSSDVTIDGLAVTSQSTDVEIDSGASGVVVTNNTIIADPGPGVLVNGAPGTDVVSNTVSYCNTGVELAGSSTGSTLENNIAQLDAVPVTNPSGCTVAGSAAFSVGPDSTPQTVADYNLIDPVGGTSLYSWGGTSYTSLASFTAATGQGMHDIAADPQLDSESFQDPPDTGAFYFSPGSFSPAIDSANADAPGEQPTDQFGNPRADDPFVANTGTGPGYYDRGAVEEEQVLSYGSLTLQPDPADGPLAVTASAPITSAWTTNGPLGTDEYSFGGSSLPVPTDGASSASHIYATAGVQFVQVSQSEYGFPGSSQQQTLPVAVGANYTPVTPTRILDTRIGLGAAKGAIPSHGDLSLQIPSIGRVSPASVALNVTVTSPTSGGELTVFNQPGAGADTSNINFSAHQTIANLVTIQPVSGAITFQNNSSGTVQVVADLNGYYSDSGSGFQGVTPVRVLDTRSKIGTTAAGPVPAHGVVRLNLSGKVPAGASAAVLNLTVTQPKEGGAIVAYADGQPVPGTSNLNFAPGQTIPNEIIVPLTNDIGDFYNLSTGTVQLVADLEGYYSPGATGSFLPDGPTRIVDTRVGLGVTAGAVPAHGTLVVTPAALIAGCGPQPTQANCVNYPVADVLNVLVTQPQTAGALVVYPASGQVPGTSDLNFSAGETIANLVTVLQSNGQVAIYNDSSGSVQIVVDEEGYFADPS